MRYNQFDGYLPIWGSWLSPKWAWPENFSGMVTIFFTAELTCTLCDVWITVSTHLNTEYKKASCVQLLNGTGSKTKF